MAQESDESLLARLLDLPEEERDSFLRRAGLARPELRERLERIQAVLRSPSSHPREKSGAAPVSDEELVRVMELALETEESASKVIGPYKLLEKIGEGGFGTIWMAEQREPVRRQVALKVIKSGMDTREVIARFEAERQALALMDHPHIARVFDAGATDAGRPYFVMELVRGTPITTYCDEHRVTTRERMRLFIAVCQAVQHAHQKGIIHRDLKPSNILVTQHDGVPVPKVIDFGIAKATEKQLTEKTLFTQFHAFIGTPAYTSPEQMELSGLDVDTRSDIYSLGVLLYELLAGHPPFDPTELHKVGLEEIRRTIREVDAPPPSQRVRSFSEEIRAPIAKNRGTDGPKLSLLLRGDLDWIVMHCLEKNRTRRYDTANDLAADVRRYLADETVLARPPSTFYRLHKLIRRHRLGFVTGVAIAVSLLGGLVVSSVLLVRERVARTRAVAAERDADRSAEQARLAAAKSAQVAQFVTDMLNGVGPNVALGRDTGLLREILDATARRLENETETPPAVAANLRDTLGTVYSDLGQYATAETLLRSALLAHRRLFGNESAETATSLDHLGHALIRLNRVKEAETLLQEALATRRSLLGNEDARVSDTLYQLALAPNPQRSTTEKRTLLNEVLAIRRKVYGPEHAAVAEAIAGLGLVAQMDFEHSKGAALHTEALAMRRRLLGNHHPSVAESLDNLGYSLAHELDRKKEAAEVYGESFAIRRRVLGDQHPKMVVSLLRFTGQFRTGQVDPEAIALTRGFIANQRKLLPPDSALLGPSLLALASLLEGSTANRDEAEKLIKEAHPLLAKSSQSATPLDGEVISAMAFFSWSRFVGRSAREALPMSEEVLKLAQDTFGPESNEVLQPTRSLAMIYYYLGEHEKATQQYEAAVKLDRLLLGPDHGFNFIDLATLGASHRARGQLARSHRVLENALASYQAEPGKPETNSAAGFLSAEFGVTLIREARFVEAETQLRAALVQYDRREMRPIALRLNPRSRFASALGRALAEQGKFTEAESLALDAFREFKAEEPHLIGNTQYALREILENVIALYRAWGKADKVAEWEAKLEEEPLPNGTFVSARDGR